MLKITYAVCNIDYETWTVNDTEPYRDWDYFYYTWIKGYLIDDKGEINSKALNTSKQSFFFEPLKGTWLHFFKDNKPCFYDTDKFLEEEKFMTLESLDIEAALKEKLRELATYLMNSDAVKEEFEKLYYGNGY